MEQVPKN